MLPDQLESAGEAEPVQLVALDVPQPKVTDWPALIEEALEVIATTGGEEAETVTVALRVTLPPGPVQVIP